MKHGFKVAYFTKSKKRNKKKQAGEEKEREETVLLKVQICGYASFLPGFGVNVAAKQTGNKRAHRQTFTDAHCDFFCMTGATVSQAAAGPEGRWYL